MRSFGSRTVQYLVKRLKINLIMYPVDIPELAVALYAQGILPFGKATELARMSRFAFAGLTEERNIPRHYSGDDLAQDSGYARDQ